ncbi:hypothetical protein GGI07_000874 [Coemansia sp. Benny D115]|nr:hypothetical protein GGI07_000874 [Coemansia sp. Benny D115]
MLLTEEARNAMGILGKDPYKKWKATMEKELKRKGLDTVVEMGPGMSGRNNRRHPMDSQIAADIMRNYMTNQMYDKYESIQHGKTLWEKVYEDFNMPLQMKGDVVMAMMDCILEDKFHEFYPKHKQILEDAKEVELTVEDIIRLIPLLSPGSLSVPEYEDKARAIFNNGKLKVMPDLATVGEEFEVCGDVNDDDDDDDNDVDELLGGKNGFAKLSVSEPKSFKTSNSGNIKSTPDVYCGFCNRSNHSNDECWSNPHGPRRQRSDSQGNRGRGRGRGRGNGRGRGRGRGRGAKSATSRPTVPMDPIDLAEEEEDEVDEDPATVSMTDVPFYISTLIPEHIVCHSTFLKEPRKTQFSHTTPAGTKFKASKVGRVLLSDGSQLSIGLTLKQGNKVNIISVQRLIADGINITYDKGHCIGLGDHGFIAFKAKSQESGYVVKAKISV